MNMMNGSVFYMFAIGHHFDTFGHPLLGIGHFWIECRENSCILNSDEYSEGDNILPKQVKDMEETMKKFVIILFFLFLFFLLLNANEPVRVAFFPELNRPFSIDIYSNALFITDGPVVYIHDLTHFKLLSSFGRKGEGPGEFKINPNINQGSVKLAFKDYKILVTSLGRVSYFTMDGKFIEQKSIEALFGFGFIYPFQDRFVGLGVAGEAMKQYFTLNFYTPEFRKGQGLIRIIAFEQGKNINPVNVGILPAFSASQDHLFFLDYEGLIHQFDKHGNELMAMNISKLDNGYSRLAVSQKRRDRYVRYFLSDPRYKAQFERDENIVKFPPFFPLLKDFRVDQGRIYAISFREKGQLKEMFILDSTTGQVLKKIMVSLGDINPRELIPFTVKDGVLYQLRENPDTEEWELHTCKVF